MGNALLSSSIKKRRPEHPGSSWPETASCRQGWPTIPFRYPEPNVRRALTRTATKVDWDNIAAETYARAPVFWEDAARFADALQPDGGRLGARQSRLLPEHPPQPSAWRISAAGRRVGGSADRPDLDRSMSRTPRRIELTCAFMPCLLSYRGRSPLAFHRRYGSVAGASRFLILWPRERNGYDRS